MRSKLTALRGGPLRTPDTLRDRVQAHLDRARTVAAQDAFLDLDAAQRVAETLLVLLQDWTQFPEPERRLVQAACLYFVADDDAEPDFDSLVGFDDDVEAVNHTLDLLRRPELRIDL